MKIKHTKYKPKIIIEQSPDDTLTELFKEIKSYETEVISSPIRFNGVSMKDIERVFQKHGVDTELPF